MSQIDWNRIYRNIQDFVNETVLSIREAINDGSFRRIKLKKNVYLVLGGFIAFLFLTVVVPRSIGMIGGGNSARIMKAQRSLYSCMSRAS